jgi:hypothetical protein
MTYPWTGGSAWTGADPWPGPDGTGGPITLTVTPQPDNSPPRVRIDVNDATNSITSLTVRRLDPDGRYRKVRTSDDAPLPLDAGSATIFDHEAPFGAPVTYTTDVAGSPNVTVTLAVSSAWLIHPQVPARSARIPDFVNMGSRARSLDVGVFAILEREFPVTATAGARLAPSGTLTVRTYTDSERVALDGVLSDGSVLLLNIPASKGLGVPTSYVQLFDTSEDRIANFGPLPYREWPLQYQTVDRPAGGTQAGVSWNDYATVGDDDYTAADGSQFTTWAEVAAAYDSWAALSAPTV